MKQYILALDQGTTSSRAILFDHEGRACGCAAREFPQHFPQPGWVEHDPDDIWASQLAVAREVLRDAHVRPEQVRAIGIANQRETTVLWDRATGRPVAPAIVWQDRRTAEHCDALLTSVTCAPHRFHASQLSTVPKHSSPRSARCRAPGT
jgi:glycerol kinase